jgi:CubicO group peptidase (beta-lactamase class C family)
MHRRIVSLSLPALALGLTWREVGAQSIPLSTPEATRPSGVAYPAFDQLGKKIEADYPDVESVVVVRKGQVLFEHYKSAPEALRDVQSVTKSVLSLAVGAALGQGSIKSLDQPVGELLGVIEKGEPPAPSPPVTIRHLLTMTAGFRTQERFAPGTADDPAFLLRRERVEAPGAVFAYDNLSANLLSIALEAATGQSASTFAEQAIFRPLGITAYDWKRGSKGHSLGSSGLHLRTRDMARLGELALNTGVWSDRQVVPESYARSAVMPQNSGGRPVGLSYGFMWWVVPSAPERRTFLASGWGGQFIWAHPPLDLVIATTSAVSAEANRRGQALALIRTELFRAAAATNP